MSSKARRKRREWMQAQWDMRVVHVEQFQDKCDKAIAAEKARSARELQGLREDLTRMIPNDDENTIYPSGKITTPYIQVACSRDRIDLFNPEKYNPYYDHVKIFGLQAEQFALVLPDGRKVVWWGWKLR